MGVFGACFGGAFKCNRRVDTYERRHAFMAAVPEEVYRHSRTLQELHLDSNNIRELPRQFFKLTNLKVLNMCDNDLTHLPQDITQISQLVQLDLSRNDIPQIPDNIKMLGSLEMVDFSANPLTQIPPSLCHLRSLKQLRINAISLERFPDCIGELKSLVQLEARENMITALPDGLCDLESLEQLDLGENEIDGLPENFGNLTKLRELWLDTNDIKALPESIGRLAELSIADFANNKIEIVPDSIEGCIGLTDLTLRQNYLSQLPTSIGKLKNLQVLKVDENKLTDLAHTIGDCAQLTELVLTENLLSVLPESLGQLTRLNVLNVDRNRLYVLTNRIGQCQALRVLSLRENLLKEIPPSIGDCQNLHVINVSGNQLDYLPHTLLQLDVKAIWLSENQAQPLMKFQQDTLVGAGGPRKVLTCFLLPQRQANHQPIIPTTQQQEPAYVPEPTGTQIQFDESDDLQPMNRDEWNAKRNKDATPLPASLQERKLEQQAVALRKQQELRKSQEHLDQPDPVEQPDEIDEDLTPLISENEPDSPQVKFAPESPETNSEPMESRLKRKNTPHYKRDLAVDPALGNGGISNILEAIPQLDLSKAPRVVQVALAGDGSFGLSIAGGGGSPPYIEGDGGVFISRVVPEGRADQAGIQVGDKLVEINGHDVTDSEHEAVANQLRELRSTNKTPLFVLHRFPLVQGYQRMDEESDCEVETVNPTQLDFSTVSAEEEPAEETPLMMNGTSEHSETTPLVEDLEHDSDKFEETPPPPVVPVSSVKSPAEEEVGCVPLTPPPLPRSELTHSTPHSDFTSPPPPVSLNEQPEVEEETHALIESEPPPIPPPQPIENQKSAQINRDFQSPRPFAKVESPTDGATLSFKDKMKLFRESGGSKTANAQSKKISLVSAQDVKSIKADESRKLISQSAAELRREKFFDMDNADDIYRQTADLDSGGGNNDGPPRIQKQPQSNMRLPENPLEAFNSQRTRDEDIRDFEQDFHKSLGSEPVRKDWELDAQRAREERRARLMQFDNDAARATKVLRREKSLKSEEKKA